MMLDLSFPTLLCSRRVLSLSSFNRMRRGVCVCVCSNTIILAVTSRACGNPIVNPPLLNLPCYLLKCFCVSCIESEHLSLSLWSIDTCRNDSVYTFGAEWGGGEVSC